MLESPVDRRFESFSRDLNVTPRRSNRGVRCLNGRNARKIDDFSSSDDFADSSTKVFNPFDSTIEMDKLEPKQCRSPKVTYNKNDSQRSERTRHSYPTNSFVRKTKDLRCFIISETERLISQDVRNSLGACSRQELDAIGGSQNCAIRRRMYKLGLL